MTPLRLGTRRSPLARAQAGQVAVAVQVLLGRPVELVDVTTRGDIDPAPLATIGGTGVFVSALRDALRGGEVDLAVHSMKDLPTALPPGLALAAVPERADPRDALVAPVPPPDLPPGSVVGTGSPRRAAVLRSWGLEAVAIRGNVDTRLARVRSGDLAGVVLAMAGLTRLGRTDVGAHPLEPSTMLPAPGQGALAVETRENDPLATSLAALDHPPSRAAVAAERAVLAHLEAGCSAPVAAYATTSASTLDLRGSVFSADGRTVVAHHLRTDLDLTDLAQAADLGRRLAQTLLVRGAADLVPAPSTPHLEETTL